MTPINFDDLFKSLPNKPLLSLFEVANFLGLSKRTIYRLYPDVLQGTKLESGIKIYRVSVVEYVKGNHCKKATDEPEDMEIIPKKQVKPIRSTSSWVKSYQR